MRASLLIPALLAGLLFCSGAACRDPQKQGPPTPMSSDPSVSVAARGSSAGATTAPAGLELKQESAATRPSGFGQEESRLVQQPDEIVSRLKNGLLVIARRVPSPVVSVRGYVHTGGIYEGKWLGGGLSHITEHLVAGGSCQRRTKAQNLDLLQKIGNNSDAYTSTNHTAYFVNTTPEHMSQAVDLVTGWMLGALITPTEFNREHQVVQRELEKDEGEPDRVFYDLTQQNRYHVSPGGVPVIGYQAVIKKLTRNVVYRYYKKAYVPNNMIFAVAGDLPPEKMLAAVQKYVDDVPPGRAFQHTIQAEPPVIAPRTLVATFPKLGQARLEIAFPTVTLYGRDMYPLDLLATILGGGESSILTEEFRDKQHLVNAVSVSDYTPSYVTGTFTVDMELNPKNIPAARDALLAILDRVSKTPIASERVQSAKVQMRRPRQEPADLRRHRGVDGHGSDGHGRSAFSGSLCETSRGGYLRAVAGGGKKVFRAFPDADDRAGPGGICRRRRSARGRVPFAEVGANDPKSRQGDQLRSFANRASGWHDPPAQTDRDEPAGRHAGHDAWRPHR